MDLPPLCEPAQSARDPGRATSQERGLRKTGMNLPIGGLDPGHDVCNARERGLVGNGRANDQPALAALVESLGRECAKDGRPRVIYCPPGEYLIADATTVWKSGVSLTGAGPGATRFVLANTGSRR